MVGDFFTKPLQGAVFIRFRELIMGKVAHDFSKTLTKQAFNTSKPRSVLGNSLQKGSGEVRINNNVGASVQTHVVLGNSLQKGSGGVRINKMWKPPYKPT